jgi:hypothetical protein
MSDFKVFLWSVLGLVACLGLVSGPDYWVISQTAVRGFHIFGLTLGTVGAGTAIWGIASGRAFFLPSNSAKVVVLAVVFVITWAGLGYGVGRYLVPPVAIMLTGGSGGTPIVIQTNGYAPSGSRRLPGCRAKLPVAAGGKFAGQNICMWTPEFKRGVEALEATRALVRIDGWTASWGAIYWRTTLVLPEFLPAQ